VGRCQKLESVEASPVKRQKTRGNLEALLTGGDGKVSTYRQEEGVRKKRKAKRKSWSTKKRNNEQKKRTKKGGYPRAQSEKESPLESTTSGRIRPLPGNSKGTEMNPISRSDGGKSLRARRKQGGGTQREEHLCKRMRLGEVLESGWREPSQRSANLSSKKKG